MNLGKMKPSGLLEAEKAKKDGRWENAYGPRPRHKMSHFMEEALKKSGLLDTFNNRPPYQRNDYTGWIESPKLEETRQKHLSQMLDELKKGNVYMKMPWRSKNNNP